jgi:hypothetical protein
MLSVIDSERFELRISPELLAEIDAWRRVQPDIPPRATAVKRLIAIGLRLAAEEAPAKKKKATKPESKK